MDKMYEQTRKAEDKQISPKPMENACHHSGEKCKLLLHRNANSYPLNSQGTISLSSHSFARIKDKVLSLITSICGIQCNLCYLLVAVKIENIFPSVKHACS